MEDELELFIREHKARVAQDRASLEIDPPYMEIQGKPHRSYGSLLKENIPPKLTVQEQEEITNVGLPLGVEYERKKKGLQHELRMDYRRYIAQQNCVLKQRPPSRKDVATLTEASQESQRPHSPPQGSTQHVRRELPVDQESEKEPVTKEKLIDVGNSWGIGLDSSYERVQPRKDDGREKRDVPTDFVRQSRRSRTMNKTDEAEFSTGLLIGEIETDETLQRRKERYREALQEQMAEQYRNKKRHRELELKVAATGANDPEKKPNRIRQFGLSKRKESQLLGHLMLGQSESSTILPNHSKTDVGGRGTPPPDLPHVAFQSPMFDCSSATVNQNGSGLAPNRQPVVLSFPRAMDTSRIPLLPPHPPHIVSEAYRVPYRDPHYYYGNGNLLDPNLAYYGHLPYPAVGLPLSYYNMPPGGVVPSQFGDTSPQSGSSIPEASPQPNAKADTTASHTGLFPPERPGSTREKTLSYRDDLKKQIQEEQERKRVEREEQERYEAKLEADMKRHQPWGRGGGGAPLKDSTGNLIADLKQMHKLNEEAYSNPEHQQRASAVMPAGPAECADHNDRHSGSQIYKLNEEAPSNPDQQQIAPVEHIDPNDRISGFTHVQTPQFARGSVITNQPTPQQLNEQHKHKAYLKQQIEEKLHKKAEERERNRQEDEKLERKVAEQMARIKREYEEEQEKKRLKELEQKAKEQKLLKLAEQRKMEAERKKTEEREKDKQREQEKQAQVPRESSPPVPALQGKNMPQHYSSRPPIVESRRSTAPVSEQSLSGNQSPPVPACRNQLRAAGGKLDVYNELSALRKQLRAEQKRLEHHLQQRGCDEIDSLISGRQARPQVDVFDMARLRLQAPVRKPHPRNTEPSNLLRIHDSLQLDYLDCESRLSSNEIERMERMGVASRRRQVYSDPHQKLSSRRSTRTNDFDMSPPHQYDLGQHARGSLLESDSAFLAPLGDAFPVPSSPEAEETPQLSARARRRLTRQFQHSPELDNPTHSRVRKQREAESSSEEKSPEKLSPSCRGNTAGTVDLSDDDLSPTQISHLPRNIQSSVESFSTDSWMRPGTSETLSCFAGSVKRN
ncbi:centrosome and spindle pole-associated protein 1-like isoform X2 [Syngnathoides biaculeatus]|uniref:centrosome and spindle pole-associated protein 1-like isoform X2 n=1 Tax=Syngnathoides biaculeatus TaxID=300417 RepID=UPI002ADE7065|nr:centrosome and spindle pole-associated protein 1-like isoform X2 [Syngnathoides biaculeatus]